MKKVLALSLITVMLIAEDSSSYLILEHSNKIIDSTFTEEGVKSQGNTIIENGAFVDNVHILQKPSSNDDVAGNLIIDSRVTSQGSQIHQGLTHVKSGGKLQDAKLESENEINNLEVMGGESFVSQANMVVGEDSNLSNLLNNGDGNDVGDGTADQFLVKQKNLIKDISIKNATIHQGLITIETGSSVSNLESVQNNRLKRSQIIGSNEINASTVTQGHIQLKKSLVDNIKQNLDNSIDNLETNDGIVHQASIETSQSTIDNINHKQDQNNRGDSVRNEILNTQVIDASILQSTLNIDSSLVETLNKFQKNNVETNNLIQDVKVENNATLSQSTITISNQSHINTIEYKIADNTEANLKAINEIKNVSLQDDSSIEQDSILLNDSIVNDMSLKRTNRVKNTDIGNSSNLKQFYTQIESSRVDKTTFSAKSNLNETQIFNSEVSQSSTTIQ